MVEMKASELDPSWNSNSHPDKRKYIIDVNLNVTVATTNIQLEEPWEGKHLFHSQMYLNRTPLHLIVDNESQQNLNSIKVIKRLKLLTTPYPQPYNIGWLS